MVNIFSGSNNSGGYWLKFEDNDKIKNTKIPGSYYKIKLITTKENLEKDLSDECLIDRYNYPFEFSIITAFDAVSNMYQTKLTAENKLERYSPFIFTAKYHQKLNMVFCLEYEYSDYYYIIGVDPYQNIYINYSHFLNESYLSIDFFSYYEPKFLKKNNLL